MTSGFIKPVKCRSIMTSAVSTHQAGRPDGVAIVIPANAIDGLDRPAAYGFTGRDQVNDFINDLYRLRDEVWPDGVPA